MRPVLGPPFSTRSRLIAGGPCNPVNGSQDDPALPDHFSNVMQRLSIKVPPMIRTIEPHDIPPHPADLRDCREPVIQQPLTNFDFILFHHYLQAQSTTHPLPANPC